MPASLSTGSITCYGTDGAVESGVTIYAYQTHGPGTSGLSYDGEEFSFTSNGSGVASHAGFIQGGTYKIRRGTGKEVTVVVPAAATFDISELIGYP